MMIREKALLPLLWILLSPPLGARSVGTLCHGGYTFCSGSSLWTLDSRSGTYTRQDRTPPPLDPGEYCFWDGKAFLVAKFPPQRGIQVVTRETNRKEHPVATLRPREYLLGALSDVLLTEVSAEGRTTLCLIRRPEGGREWIQEQDPARSVVPGLMSSAITVDDGFLVFRNTGEVLSVSKNGAVKTIQEDFWKAVGPELYRREPEKGQVPRPPGELHADPVPVPDGRIHLVVTCSIKVQWTAEALDRAFKALSPTEQAKVLAAEGLQQWKPRPFGGGGYTIFVISIDPATGAASLLDPGRYRVLWRPHPHVALRTPRFERMGEFGFDKDGCLSPLEDILHEQVHPHARHSPPPE